MQSRESRGSPLFSSRPSLTLIIFSIVLSSGTQLKVNFVFPQACGVPNSMADKGQYDKVPLPKRQQYVHIFFLVIYFFNLIISFSSRLHNNAANDTEYKPE